MKPSSDYLKVKAQAQGRSDRLVRDANDLISGGLAGPGVGVMYLVIEAYSLWYGLNRAVFLSCATGARHPQYGRIATPHGNLSAQDAMDRAVWFGNRRKVGQSQSGVIATSRAGVTSALLAPSSGSCSRQIVSVSTGVPGQGICRRVDFLCGCHKALDRSARRRSRRTSGLQRLSGGIKI
jgi:hypothetical protein